MIGPLLTLAGLGLGFALMDDVAEAGFGELFAFELAVDAAFLVFMVYVAIRFFGKKANAPGLMITLLAAGVIVSAIMLAIELNAGAEAFAVESGKGLVRGIIGSAIWIPYFSVSKRVKATFVN